MSWRTSDHRSRDQRHTRSISIGAYGTHKANGGEMRMIQPVTTISEGA